MAMAQAPDRSGSASPRGKYLIVALVVGGIALLVAANAHFVYVAVTSQPDCVPHISSGSGPAGTFGAAKSAC